MIPARDPSTQTGIAGNALYNLRDSSWGGTEGRKQGLKHPKTAENKKHEAQCDTGRLFLSPAPGKGSARAGSICTEPGDNGSAWRARLFPQHSSWHGRVGSPAKWPRARAANTVPHRSCPTHNAAGGSTESSFSSFSPHSCRIRGSFPRNLCVRSALRRLCNLHPSEI